MVIVPLFLATLTAAGAFYGYLRIASGSLWPVAVAHAAFNTCWEALDGLTAASSPVATEYLAGESGLLTLLAVSLPLLGRLERRPAGGGRDGGRPTSVHRPVAAG